MKVLETAFEGVKIIEGSIFPDERGFFFEIFQSDRYIENQLATPFVQDNFSRSKQHVIRGLHYQLEHAQGKLVLVTYGKVIDVIVDIRVGSKTFGQVMTVELEGEVNRQVYIPPGLAHGFCVLSDRADFIYKCTDYYYPGSEFGILWNDPDLNIPWPISNPILSPKDALYPPLKNISGDKLPHYKTSS